MKQRFELARTRLRRVQSPGWRPKAPSGTNVSAESRMQELQLRPYHDLSGAIFRAEAGWSIPAGYDSLDAEVRAIRTRAGMIDLSDRAKIELAGSERDPFVDAPVTTDLKIMRPGKSALPILPNKTR